MTREQMVKFILKDACLMETVLDDKMLWTKVEPIVKQALDEETDAYLEFVSGRKIDTQKEGDAI